jgi:hypothetical protein
MFLVERHWTIVRARFAQILAIQGTIHGDFAPGPAAGRADLAAHARTIALGAPLFTQFARIVHASLPSSYHRKMPRTDLYLKVELDIDAKESPERVAAEICRLVRRVYGVRKAEVSSMVERDGS